MRGYFQFVLRHRIPVLLLIALISVGGAWSLLNAKISSSLGKLFLANSPAYDQYLARVDEFGSDEQLIVAFEEEDVLAVDSLLRLEKVIRSLRKEPGVGRVMSLLDNRQVFKKSGEGGLGAGVTVLRVLGGVLFLLTLLLARLVIAVSYTHLPLPPNREV